ncbi:unnamed protein product [Closterium sp. NIES-53]
MRTRSAVFSCVLLALLLSAHYVEASHSRKLLASSENPDYSDLFDYLDSQKEQSGSSTNAGEPSDLPNAAAQQALLAMKAAWGGDFFGADTWVSSSSGAPAPSPEASPPSEASPSEASPSEASPSEASPSEASPSEASPSEASPSKASPSTASPSEPNSSQPVGNSMGVGELGMGFGNMGMGSGGLGPGDLWRGVGIDSNGDVVSLELPESGVSGPLPLDLSQLTLLTTLDLGGNNLSGLEGNFPWNEILTQANSPLILLRLDDNSFVGEIPDNTFENATQLHSLTLCGNKFTGPIPSSLGSASEISVIDLSRNWFTGSVPPTLADKLALEVLTLSHNRLSGEIPEFIGKLPAIVNLDLSHNWFIGHVPASFSSFGQSLRGLQLSYNALTGPLPRFTGLGKECENPEVDSVSCYRFEVFIDLSANYFEGRADMAMQMPGSERFPKPSWGAKRWTSGRKKHARTSAGQAAKRGSVEAQVFASTTRLPSDRMQ